MINFERLFFCLRMFNCCIENLGGVGYCEVGSLFGVDVF